MSTRAMLAGAGVTLLLANAVALAWLTQRGPLAAPPDAAARQIDGRCTATESFANLREALAVAARTESRGGAAHIQAVAAAGRPDYLVYLGPHVSRGTARRALRELQGRSIDGHIIGAGELANAVALGIFARRDAAEARRQEVAAAGYEASIKPVARPFQGYAVAAHNMSSGSALSAPCQTIAAPPRAS